MRIGIDIRYLSHGLVGGVHAYVQHFVPALLEQANGHEVFLYADAKRPLELYDVSRHDRVHLRILPWKNGLSSIYHDLLHLRDVMAHDRLEVAHFPANYGFGPAGARTVITLHDEINIMPWREIIQGHPKTLPTIAMMTYLHLCSTAAVREARLILTVSEYARQQIARYSGLPVERIVPVHHGTPPDLRRITDPAALAGVRQRHGLPAKFILADGLKNPGVIVRAWQRLPQSLRTGRQIVFFARRPDVLPVIREAVAEGSARLLIRASRSDLIALYSQAEAFVFPSWIEGFGMPILEAMTCGAPVVASTRGSIPEVAGDAAWFMDAEDDGQLASYLSNLFSVPQLGADLRERGFARAAQFSWSRAAQAILASYQLALAN